MDHSSKGRCRGRDHLSKGGCRGRDLPIVSWLVVEIDRTIVPSVGEEDVRPTDPRVGEQEKEGPQFQG